MDRRAVAGVIMAGLVSNDSIIGSYHGMDLATMDKIAAKAVDMADALDRALGQPEPDGTADVEGLPNDQGETEASVEDDLQAAA